MTTNYEKGRAFEYRVRRDLQRRGFAVVRSAGSKTPADLVAGRRGYILLVQCTTSELCKDGEDREKLVAMADLFGALPVMVWKDGNRGPLVWEFLHDEFTN